MGLMRCLSVGTFLLPLVLALTASPVLARSSTEPPAPPRGKLGQDLFLAINRGDLPGVRSLLKRGADPNARNGLEFTPLFLAAASGQVPVMEALLKAGAKLDAGSVYGSALTFAAEAGRGPTLKLLLARGANIHPFRADGISVLMMLARGDDPELVRELLRRKADVNERDNDGATPLIYAAREGREAIIRLLLAAGAPVDGADSHRWTPLMYAAVNGHPDCVRLLQEKGANINAREDQGRTPLLLAAKYGDHPEVIRALLAGGADPRAADAAHHTALALAAARGHTECAQLLGTPGESSTAGAALRTPEQAAQISLKVLQRSMLAFNQRTGCISCHQEGLGRMATAAAQERGLLLDPAVERAQRARVNGAVNAMLPLHLAALKSPAAMKNVPLIEIGEVSTGDTWLFAGMAAHRQPATAGTAAMAMVLARQQAKDGAWTFTVPRVPMQSSFFTTTALAIRSLRAYAPRASAAEISQRISRAKQWLLTAPTEKSEDRASRLLGLMWAGASRAERQKAIDELRADQQPDGGWPQLPSLKSDAYATGQALYALHLAGELPVSDAAYQRGVQFLLRTQDEDGSWFVSKRATPVNNYFDAAFPHGESQYSSFNGTCWAMMALLQTLDRPQPGSQRAAR
jgi:ankyrin repeat protein